MMARASDWERLARLIEDDDSVATAVLDAVEQGDDPWEALLDGLDEAGALAYLRADDTGMELTEALAQLPRVFAVQPDLDEAADTDDLPTATRLADIELSEAGLRIVRLVEDEESWPLVVVAEKKVAMIVERIIALGAAASAGG